MPITIFHRTAPSGRLVLECVGRVDALTASRLREELQGAAARAASDLVVDLSRVDQLEAAGVAAIAGAAAARRRRGVGLRLVAPSTVQGRRILDFSGLEPLLASWASAS